MTSSISVVMPMGARKSVVSSGLWQVISRFECFR